MPAVAFASVLAHTTGPGTVAVRVRLVVAYGPSLPVLAAAVREQIVTHVRRLTDVRVAEVELSVDDLAGLRGLPREWMRRLLGMPWVQHLFLADAVYAVDERSRDRDRRGHRRRP
jgi:hypothetical protein